MTTILSHAKHRIEERFYQVPDMVRVVMGICDEKEDEIRQYSSYYQVLVTIKTLKKVVRLPDGSTGNIIVAAIDPKNMEVKTVMLRQDTQKDRPGTKRI